MNKRKEKVEQYKCEICHKIFDNSFNLELHYKCHEEKAREFKCNQCDLYFYVKWRLDKHVESHQQKNNYFCHYCNNDKNCPFEEIGCKFQHKKSKLCWFADNCKAKLCPFIHKENSSASICNNLTTQQATIVEDDLVYCDFCEQKFSSESKVKQHIKVSHKEVANDVLLNAYWERDDQVIYSFECGNCRFETTSDFFKFT